MLIVVIQERNKWWSSLVKACSTFTDRKFILHAAGHPSHFQKWIHV